ncbi:hypothetical protein, partial [Mangrovimicrobium sediminis]|uniref:hypothetical protein n=1 Tax=Mangrovimicrobium sediminis TaxID=2562682 RepID=UPI0019813118
MSRFIAGAGLAFISGKYLILDKKFKGCGVFFAIPAARVSRPSQVGTRLAREGSKGGGKESGV